MRFIAFDTETWLIQPGRLAPRVVCLSYSEAGCPDGLLDRNFSALEALVRGWLLNPGITLVAHNAAFDVGALSATFPHLEPLFFDALEAGRVRCTKIREGLRKLALGRLQHDPANKMGPARLDLGSLVEELLGEYVEGKGGGDAWRFRYHELDGVPLVDWPEAARTYATLDARYCRRVFEAQTFRNGGDDLFADEVRQTKAAYALHRMAAWGLRADGASVEVLKADLEEKTAAADKRLVAAGLMTVVKGETKTNLAALREAVTNAYDGAPPTTEKGAVQYGGAVLREVPCRGGVCNKDEGTVCEEPLHLMAAVSEDRGELSKYVPWLEKAATAPVCVKVSPLVSTGRCAVSAPPLQQLPRRRGVRDCFTARPGTLFVGADYSQAELVALGQILLDLFGKSRLAETIQEGKDIHLVVAAELLHTSYEDALARKKEKSVKDKRQLSKALNFGLPGGLGPDTFVEFAKDSWGVRVTREEAVELKSWWLRIFPEMRDYFEVTASKVNAAGGSFDLVQPRSGRIRGGVRFCDGCNSPFQGLAADMAKDALWRLTRECASGRGPLGWARPVLFVHDEIVGEVPESQASEAADRWAQVMVEAGKTWCPDMPVQAEPYIMRRWYKGAETVRVDGRVVEWTP